MIVIGVDEVGRGPIAGPVVACSVSLKKSLGIKGDSKSMTLKKRYYFYNKIIEYANYYHIGIVSHKKIDEINILNASKLAMEISLEKVNCKDDLIILIDGIHYLKTNFKSVAVPKADNIFEHVAAASIMAKVKRDLMMQDISKIYPLYDFSSNMGYPTLKHIKALKKYGPCPYHRKTFKPVSNVIRSS